MEKEEQPSPWKNTLSISDILKRLLVSYALCNYFIQEPPIYNLFSKYFRKD